MLVSAIMPTGDRPELAPLALACFLRQTWPEKELIVLDDGKQKMSELFAGVDGVRYLYLPTKTSLGLKRNLGVAWALGEVVIHWDDDDWSAPVRIQDQVHYLQVSGKAVTGYHQIFYWDQRQGLAFDYRYQGLYPYACGTSQCYRRDWALSHPFPGKSYGEDTEFSHAAAGEMQLTSVEARHLMVARVHAKSTGRLPLGSRGFRGIDHCELSAQFFADLAGIGAAGGARPGRTSPCPAMP